MKNSPNLQKKAKAELAKRQLAKRRLANFCEYVYEGYLRSWHTDLLCEVLEKVEKGEIRFLLIELPPRHSKSLHVSQLFPAWVVGRDKNKSVIVSSYSGDLATDHGRETRNLIKSKRYQNIFDTKLAPDSDAKGKWNTDGKGAYNAAGVGGSITGKGADIFVVDDPLKDRKEADSLPIRDDRYKWLRSVARTRLTPDGAMVIMHTRWHDDDMIGRIEAEDDWVDYFEWLRNGSNKQWVRLTLPAIAEHDEPHRKAGEALWPARYDLTELSAIKKDIGSYEWSALYQQNPIDEENRVFKQEWFKYRDYDEVMDMNCVSFMTIDTKATNKKEAGTDYIGITIDFVDQLGNWNLMSERRKMSGKELVDFLFTAHTNYNLSKIGIEKTAYTEGLETYLDQEMRQRKHFLPLVELSHGGTKKEIRIEGLQPRYERGAVFHIMRYGKNTCVDLEEELLRFPVAVNDDASDSAAYLNQVVEYSPEEEDGEVLGIY